jgi:hypothetical protein
MLTQIYKAMFAVITFTTAYIRRCRNDISFFETGNISSHIYHGSACLMPHYLVENAVFQSGVKITDVAAADTTGFYLYQDSVIFTLRSVYFLNNYPLDCFKYRRSQLLFSF